MRHNTHEQAGFSLMEVNMAVFVMAIGILGMVALFPLGLREGIQARADLKQSMFADHVLNQLAAILSQTNMTWNVWENLDGFKGTGAQLQSKLSSISKILPKDMGGSTINLGTTIPGEWNIGVGDAALNSKHYEIICRVPDDLPSARILGITVRSTDTDDQVPTDQKKKESWDVRHEPYYTEVLFNGVP